MHGQVTFQYFLHKGPGAGTVFFQLFGQKCRVCVRQRQRERSRAAATASASAATSTVTTASAGAAGAGAGVGAVGGAAAGASGVLTPPPEEEGAVAAVAPAAAAQPAGPREDDGVPYANPMWYPDEVRRVSIDCCARVGCCIEVVVWAACRWINCEGYIGHLTELR